MATEFLLLKEGPYIWELQILAAMGDLELFLALVGGRKSVGHSGGSVWTCLNP